MTVVPGKCEVGCFVGWNRGHPLESLCKCIRWPEQPAFLELSSEKYKNILGRGRWHIPYNFRKVLEFSVLFTISTFCFLGKALGYAGNLEFIKKWPQFLASWLFRAEVGCRGEAGQPDPRLTLPRKYPAGRAAVTGRRSRESNRHPPLVRITVLNGGTL